MEEARAVEICTLTRLDGLSFFAMPRARSTRSMRGTYLLPLISGTERLLCVAIRAGTSQLEAVMSVLEL